MASDKQEYIKNLDLIITRNFLKPNENKPNHFLQNTSSSMRNFELDKHELFTFDQILKVVQDKMKTHLYRIKSSNVKTAYCQSSYKQCLMTGKPYEETLSFEIEIIQEIQKKNVTNSEIEKYVIMKSIAEIKIPTYIGHCGESFNKEHYYYDPLETGGYFVTKHNIKKYVVHKEDRICTILKYGLLKNNLHHGSINNMPLSFINPLDKPQFLILDIDLNLTKLSLYISSKKTLPSLNIIILIAFLTKYSFNTLKKVLKSYFESEKEIYDYKVLDIIDILFDQTKLELSIFQNENKDLKDVELIDRYIKKNFVPFYNKVILPGVEKHDENYVKELPNIYLQKIFFEWLLPGVNSLYNFLDQENLITNTRKNLIKVKGMTLFHTLKNLIIAGFQNSIYVTKYHLANRRIATAGDTFKSIVIENIKNLIKDYQEQLDKQLKNSSKSRNNLTFTSHRRIHNAINNVFNMQDKKYSSVVKFHKTTNYYQRYVTPALVGVESSISLTKYFNSRDPDLSTWRVMGPVDTPDHAEYVGINRRLNVGTIINDKDIKTHKNLIKKIYQFISLYLSEHSKLNGKIDKEVVNIILVEDSEIWIGCIEQAKIKDLYQQLLQKKRQNIFGSNLIDISLTPYYKTTDLKILLPIDKYHTLRINIGNKIPFMPVYLVKNGELVFTKIKYNQNLEELKHILFEQFIQEYEIIEYLGPEQFAYSNVCENITTFMSLPHEERIQYEYVSMDNSLNLSILESLIFDLGKMPGARGIFSTSQIKNVISSIQPDSLNNIEASKFTGPGVQEPCIINDILLESRIPKQSYGTHVMLAFMAYKDNIEDSIIINRESVNNGLFVTINILLYKGVTDYNKGASGDINIKQFRNSYKKLDNDGIPKLNTVLEMGDALYGNTEVKIKKNNDRLQIQDMSIPYKFLIPGRVDRILLSTEDTSINIRYTVAVCHYAERGHKMSNQCAQKATISKIAQAYELPYNSYGKSPDIFINTLSITNRKTINMYTQTLATNLFSYLPENEITKKKQFINYKSFSDNNILFAHKFTDEFKKKYPMYSDQKIRKILDCEEILYDPYTGEMLKYPVFIGPIYYNRLTQISDEKISVRNRGRLNKLNQPPSGKQKGGSHRLGEMEVDLMATHGVAHALYEISKDSIEVQQYVLICQNCTSVATKITNNIQSYYTCINCENAKLNPIFERHLLTKVTKTLMGLLNFRGIKLNIKYNQPPILFSSEIKD